MKRVLVIDESNLLREFFKEKLPGYNIEVVVGINGLDGAAKIRSTLPDLIIMDQHLSRKPVKEVLQDKKNNPNTTDIPVILLTREVDRSSIKELVPFGIKKVFAKPIKVDAVLRSIADFLGLSITLDPTPSIIEAHYNEDILFVEIARGLNQEKIDLLRFKITEIIGLYRASLPKVLILMSDISLEQKDVIKLENLLHTVFTYAQTTPKYAVVLTKSDVVSTYIQTSRDYDDIQVVDSIEKAMDRLFGIKNEKLIEPEQQMVRKTLFDSTPEKAKETIQMRFEEDEQPLKSIEKKAKVAIVDDDFVIQNMVENTFSQYEWDVSKFSNGKEFIGDPDLRLFDLIFLDLRMPEMDGFKVLDYLNERNINIPVIILSALSKKETVIKAMQYGIKIYLTKPIKPKVIVQKTTEALEMNF